MKQDDLEIEIKFEVTDFTIIKEKLRSLGAKLLHPRRLEQNERYDYPDCRFFKAKSLLRLREDGIAKLTFKEHVSREKYKIEREYETAFEKPDQMREILKALGLVRDWRYEKYREEWQLDAVDICLDELQLGRFVEFEGSMRDIEAIVEKLGFDRKTGISKGYSRLWSEKLKQDPQDLDDLVFR